MMLDVNQYPYIDLSKMFDIPGCAVRTPTEFDAATIIANFQRQYPEYRKYHFHDTYWSNHREETAYSIWDTFEDDTPPKLSTLGYCDVPWFKGNGFTIIEFSELAQEQELEESDAPLDLLLGM